MVSCEVSAAMQASALLGLDARQTLLDVRRGGFPCPDGAQSLLALDMNTTTRPLWTAQDMAALDAPAAEQGVFEWTASLWNDIFESICTGYSTDTLSVTMISSLDLKRFLVWLGSPRDVSGTPLPPPPTLPDADAQAHRRLAAERKALEEERAALAIRESMFASAEKPATPTPPAKDAIPTSLLADLAAHPGAKSGAQLAYISNCMIVGRHATRHESMSARGRGTGNIRSRPRGAAQELQVN